MKRLSVLLSHLLGAVVMGCSPPGYCGSKRPMDEKTLQKMRSEMVAMQIAARDVSSPVVLKAMRTVPRHFFVPEKFWGEAYLDHPIPIGKGQTISQPYIVAKMTELADIQKGKKVLEIGTGSGYQAAVLAEMGADVFSIEIIESLSEQAAKDLKRAGYKNLHLRVGDGYQGWPSVQPFDAVIVTAAPEEVPQPLIDQLKVGGKLVIPVGKSGAFYYGHQELLVIEKTQSGVTRKKILPVAFVPMTGEAEKN